MTPTHKTRKLNYANRASSSSSQTGTALLMTLWVLLAVGFLLGVLSVAARTAHAAPVPYLVTLRDNSAATGTRKTGLTPTFSVFKKLVSGTWTAVASGSQPAFTEIGQGVYVFLWDAAASGEAVYQADGGSSIPNDSDRYVDGFCAADSPTILANIDAPTSTRSTYAGGAVASVVAPVVASSVTGNVGGSVGSVTGSVGSITAPVTVGTLPTTPSGYGGGLTTTQANTLAAIGAKTAALPSDPASNTVVNTRLAASAYSAPPSAAANATATALLLLKNPGQPIATDTNGNVTATNGGGGSGLTDSGIQTDVQTALTNQGYTTTRAANLDNADAPTSTRLATSAYVLPPALTDIINGVWNAPVDGTGNALLSAKTAVAGAFAAIASTPTITNVGQVQTTMYPHFGTTSPFISNVLVRSSGGGAPISRTTTITP